MKCHACKFEEPDLTNEPNSRIKQGGDKFKLIGTIRQYFGDTTALQMCPKCGTLKGKTTK